jgi:diketogulonate reductase-like aldo/keto reductase
MLADVARAKHTTPEAFALAWLLHPELSPLRVSGRPEYLARNCTADRIAPIDTEWYALLASAVDLTPGRRWALVNPRELSYARS